MIPLSFARLTLRPSSHCGERTQHGPHGVVRVEGAHVASAIGAPRYWRRPLSWQPNTGITCEALRSAVGFARCIPLFAGAPLHAVIAGLLRYSILTEVKSPMCTISPTPAARKKKTKSAVVLAGTITKTPS